MKKFYADLLPAGALVFDIGANTGQYSAALEASGARVVALEPNAACVRHIELSYPGRRIEVIQAVAGPRNGLAAFHISDQRDDISSMSDEWMRAISEQHKEYEGLWNRKVTVPMLTVDTLIEQYGMPQYVKIDVEGFEEGVLDGLSVQPPLLSFEFNPAFLDATFRCLDKKIFPAGSTFNFVVGDSKAFELDEWIARKDDIKRIFQAMPKCDRYGDVFVRREVENAG
jgi:FkbM family methyltransferase